MPSVRICTVFLSFILSLPLASQADPPIDSVRQLVINGQADAAIRALNASISANPMNADEHNLLCRVHYSEERWDAAVSECERAVSLNSKTSLNQLWLGRAYGEKAEHSSWFTAIALAKKTHAAFEKAVDLDPHNIEARSDLSEYYIEAPGFLGGGTDKAVAQANAVEKLEPATAYWIRARIAEHDKRNNDAEQAYKKAIALENSPRRLLDLASLYRRVNRLDDLETTIRQAEKLNTKNDSTLVDSASLLLRVKRNLPLASSMLRRYIGQGTRSEDAPLFQAQYLLAQILEQTGDLQGAKQAYQAAHANASAFAPAATALKRLGTA
jgi:tetratricopeptide (TPR) repeat protein